MEMWKKSLLWHELENRSIISWHNTHEMIEYETNNSNLSCKISYNTRIIKIRFFEFQFIRQLGHLIWDLTFSKNDFKKNNTLVQNRLKRLECNHGGENITSIIRRKIWNINERIIREDLSKSHITLLMNYGDIISECISTTTYLLVSVIP
jgi:hypothetical protein